MGSPHFHATKSVERWGGEVEDYLPIHEFMDSSKGAVADLCHRALTHNSWFVTCVLPRVFGSTVVVIDLNGQEIQVSVAEIGQYHVMEDFNGCYPAAMDYLGSLLFEPWMDNGQNEAYPPSHEKLPRFQEKRKEILGDESTLEVSAMFDVSPLPSSSGFIPERGCSHSGLID